MVTLFCALVGAAGSAFPVDIDANKSVGHLKDAIWAKAITEEQKRGKVASDLQLYLAKKDDTWITFNEINDVNDVAGLTHLRVPQAELDIIGLSEEDVRHDIDKHQVAAGNGPVHVLVVVPEGAERDITAATTQLTMEQTKMAINEVLDERDRKRSVYSISTCPRSKEMLLKQQLGLEYSTVPVNEVVDDSIHGYQWSELTEKDADQRKAYMEYVEEHLRDAFISRRKQKDFLKDVAGKKNLLDCDDQSRLPFKVKGTADMMIIDEVANRMDDVFAGLRFVIEVKKDRLGYDERWQLLLELVVADLKSEGRCAPVGLLTNLNDYWYFLWFTPDNKIARMVLTCPANGFKTMKEVLKERSGPTRDGQFPMRVAFLNSSLPLKRQKLLRGATGRDDAAAEMLERYELMSDELSPEFLQRQRVEYAFDLIRQMPIHSAMYT